MNKVNKYNISKLLGQVFLKIVCMFIDVYYSHTMNEEEYVKNAHYYRGYLISEFAALEKEIEFTIAGHFLHGDIKAFGMMEIVLDRMTFESKRTALKSIVDKLSERNGFIKSRNNSYPHSSFFNELRLLNDQRNYFAHFYLSIPQYDTSDVIVLIQNRDKMNMIKYSKRDIDELIEKIRAVKENVVEFHKEIKPT